MKRFAMLLCGTVLLLAGCRTTPAPVQACTLIGCTDGLTVVVQNAPAAPYTVEVTLPDGRRLTSRCDAAAGCGGGLFFENVTAERVTVRVIGSAGAHVSVVEPRYTVSQPNGPDCPPTCRHARVEVRYAA